MEWWEISIVIGSIILMTLISIFGMKIICGIFKLGASSDDKDDYVLYITKEKHAPVRPERKKSNDNEKTSDKNS